MSSVKKLRVVVIGGLGLMASPMSIHWRNQELIEIIRVHDRGTSSGQKESARKAWKESGTRLVHTFEDLVGSDDIDGVIVCCGKNGDDLPIIAKLTDLLAKSSPNAFICHMSTVSMNFVEAAYEFCRSKNVHYVNYPLTGGPTGAKNASMLILASGDLALYEKLKEALLLIGKPKYFGNKITAAAEVKLMGHLMVFNNLIGICSAAAIHTTCLNDGQLGGETQADFFDFLNGGGGGSKQWDIALSTGIKKDIWDQGFFIRHAVVDAIYAAQMCIDSGISHLAIQPIINIILAFSYLANNIAPGLATHAIVREMVTNRAKELDEFINTYAVYSSDSNTALKKSIASLPEAIRQTVFLSITVKDFLVAC